MAQKQLPGGSLLDEDASRSSQLPDGGFIGELGPIPDTEIAVPLAEITLTAFAPTVVVVTITEILVPTAEITLTAFAPTVQAVEVTEIAVPLATLTLTAYPPTIEIPPPPGLPTGSKVDNTDRIVLVQMDYMDESSGAPIQRTLYLGTKFFTDDSSSPAVRYRECIDAKSPLLFTRSLSGPTFGNYNSSLGSIEINNEDGEYDFLLRLAIDNSEVRVYFGTVGLPFGEFRELFRAVSVRADAPSTTRISVMLKDASALLNKSIGGEILVGGSASSAQKYRPANIGLIFQLPCEVLDPVTLQYVHSDRGGVEGTALQLYDRGIEVSFVDNGDGTSNLVVPPDGQVTADVLAATEANPTLHRISDAFFQIVADRCGFEAAGRYMGAGPTFTVGDADDYPMGLSIPSAQNVAREILPQIADGGNCFWAITRLGSFTFGRIQPQDIAGLGITPVKIRKDDIDDKTLKAVKVADPTYYRIQCLVNKNWYVATDVAAAVDPDRQNLLRSEGLVIQQTAAVGTTYDAAPELYDLSLAVSPVLTTILSTDPSDTPSPSTVAETWMERRRDMYLPWLEGISFRCDLQFFELELGDVVELTVDRFGCDAGDLMQVVSVSLMPVLSKVELVLLRRSPAVGVDEGGGGGGGVTEYFVDEYSGSGDLSTHLPDVGGGAYVPDGVDPLSEMPLDGAGCVYGTDAGMYAYSPFGGVPVPTFTFTVEVLIESGAVNDGTFIDIALLSGSDWIINPYMSYINSQSSYQFAAYDFDGSEGANVAAALGAHTMRVEVSASQTLWYFDDVLMFTRAGMDTSTLDRVEIGLGNQPGSTALKVSAVRVTASA